MTVPPEKESPPPAKQGGVSDNGTESYGDLCILSMVKSATTTETRSACAGELIKGIKGGRWKEPVEAIRSTYRRVIEETGGDRVEAKRAIGPEKKLLPGVLFSGKFSRRANAALVKHSGLLCADLDELGDRLPEVRAKLLKSPYVWAVFLSPSGDGLKVLFRVRADGAFHLASHRAVERYVMALTGVQIDESCKDVARMCFVSFDPDLYANESAVELPPMPEPDRTKSAAHTRNGSTPQMGADLDARLGKVQETAGPVQEIGGKHFVRCPGQHLHTQGNGPKDCEVFLDRVPTLHCVHTSCNGIVAGVNHELRSRIGRAEYRAGDSDASEGEDISARLNSNKPKVELPCDGRLLSTFAADLAEILKVHGIYERGGMACIVNSQRDGLELITPQKLRTLAEEHLVCYRTRRAGETELSLDRTMNESDAKGVLCSKQFLNRLPKIERIATARLPVMRENGAIALLPAAYDSESLTLTFAECQYEETMPLNRAREVIDDLLSEFPFADAGRSRAVAVAAMVGLYAAGLLPKGALRPVTIYLANAEGAGKTMLAKCAIAPVHGRAITDGDLKDKAETSKELLTAVIEARPYILFDNCKGHLNSSALEGFVTAPVYRGRVLGISQSFSGENHVRVFVTGNGCTVSPDMRRRSLFVELFMEDERAEDRKFRRILDDATLFEMRATILAALWAFVRGWDDAGRPGPSRPHSSFPRWAEIIGGIVEQAGYGSPLETAEIKGATDTDGADMRELVGLLDAEPSTFDQIVALARQHGLFERIIPGEGDMKPDGKSTLGKLLKRYDRRIFGGGTRFLVDGKGHSRSFRVGTDGAEGVHGRHGQQGISAHSEKEAFP